MLNKIAEDSKFKKVLKYLQEALILQHYVNTDNQKELAKYVLKDRTPEELREVEQAFKNADQDKAAAIVQYPFHLYNTVHGTGEWLLNLMRYGGSRLMAPVYGVKGIFNGDGYLEGQHKYLVDTDAAWKAVRNDWQTHRQDVEDYAQRLLPFNSDAAEMTTKGASILPLFFLPGPKVTNLSKILPATILAAVAAGTETAFGAYSNGKATGAEKQLVKDQATIDNEVIPVIKGLVSENEELKQQIQQVEQDLRHARTEVTFNEKVVNNTRGELDNIRNENSRLQQENRDITDAKNKLEQLNKSIEKRMSTLTGGSVGALTGIPAGLLVNKLLGNKSTRSKIISSIIGSGLLGLAGAYAGARYYDTKTRSNV